MSDARDESNDMRSFPLDEDTAERLLDGGLSTSDAPLGWERVALLVGVASGPAEESDSLSGQNSTGRTSRKRRPGQSFCGRGFMSSGL